MKTKQLLLSLFFSFGAFVAVFAQQADSKSALPYSIDDVYSIITDYVEHPSDTTNYAEYILNQPGFPSLEINAVIAKSQEEEIKKYLTTHVEEVTQLLIRRKKNYDLYFLPKK